MSDVLRVALVGYGNHVRKNLLTPFGEARRLELAAVQVRDPAGYAARFPDAPAPFVGDLATLLSDPAIDLIYVATPIALHEPVVGAALKAGKHVICEKALTTDAARTNALFDLAAANGRVLLEVAMYHYHAQFAAIERILADRAAAGERLLGIRARFTIPALADDDIRYNAALGGGALLDVGFYPLSAAARLMGAPDAVAAVTHRSAVRGVDLSGTALLRYGDAAFQAEWAIGASYANEIVLSFAQSEYRVPRAFSKPANLATEIAVTSATGGSAPAIAILPDDQFTRMFAGMAAMIRGEDPHGRDRAQQVTRHTATIIDAIREAQ